MEGLTAEITEPAALGYLDLERPKPSPAYYGSLIIEDCCLQKNNGDALSVPGMGGKDTSGLTLG